MAAELRESAGAREGSAAPLAAGVDGARSEQLIAARIGLTLVAGVLLRLAIAAAFHGSQDVDAQLHEARALVEGRSVYGTNHGNKLPLGYAVPAAMWLLASATGLPFAFTVKLPAIGGDLLAAALLARVGREDAPLARHGPALYLFNPLTVLLSAYHGNVDPLMAAMVLGAIVLADRDRGTPAGLVLGAAIALKQPAALALVPMLLAAAPAARLGICAGAVAVPVLVTLPFLSDPGFGRMLRYTSIYGLWGVPLLLKQAAGVGEQLLGAPAALLAPLDALNRWLATWGRYVLLAILVAWYAWLARQRRERDMRAVAHDVAATFAVFYVCATGFGVQYLAWILPCLFVVSVRLGVAWAVVVSPFVLLTYVYAQLPAKYGVVSIAGNLRVLEPGDLALVVASGVFGALAWAATVLLLRALGARVSP